jgi:hypothetical protein
LTEKEKMAYSPIPSRREAVPKRIDLPQGALKMPMLKAVSLGPLHRYGILQAKAEEL